MPYDWKIELSGVDITDKVARFDISADLSQYCRELTVEIADPAFYASLDFSVLPSAPLLEVFTMTDAAWISQGKYYMERPALSSDINQDVINGLWGRGATARLGAPFAQRVSKMWTADTSFFAICAEMCELANLTWDDSQSAIEDFYIFAYTYQAENAYPIDVVSELAELAGAIVTSDRLGLVRITAIDYAPTAADVTIDDDDWSAITETPEWPDFGNRVRIIPTGSLAGYSINVYLPDECLPADGISQARVYARVIDADGNPVDGAVVDWSTDAAAATLLLAQSNTLGAVMPPEEVTADNQYQFTLALPPSAILGVYAFADYARRENLAVDGAGIDGNTVTLATALKYCDQSLRVYYTAAGVAINTVTAGDTAEDVTVTAEIDGQEAHADLYIGNGCQCPATLTLAAIPRTMLVNSTAQLIVYAEEGGGPITDGRLVRLWQRTALGNLRWTTARLGTVRVINEACEAANDVAGLSQCTLSRFAMAGTVSVYRADVDGNATGGNLFASLSGKIVGLSTILATGTELVAHYTARGAALNFFVGSTVGTAYFRASMSTNREAPLEADASIQINDPADPTSGATGDDYTDGGYGGTGGSDGELDTDWDFGCTQADGTVVQCEDDAGDDWATHKTCCEKGGVPGCWPHNECDEYVADLACIPSNISDNPDATAEDRFAAALETGCTCEQSCQAELSAFGTTQGYDGASYRTAEEIVTEDQGLAYVEGGDNSAYNAAVSQVKSDALADCIAACETVNFTCSDNNPQTIDYEQSVDIAVEGGKPPFAWSVNSGFELAAAQTDGRANLLTAQAGACGSADVSVTDAGGNAIVCSLRHTNGRWSLQSDPGYCLATGAPTGRESLMDQLIVGKYKVLEEKYWDQRCDNGGAWIDTCTCENCANQHPEADKYLPCIDDGWQTCDVSTFSKCGNGIDCYREYTSQGVDFRTVRCLKFDQRYQYVWKC